MFSFTSVKKNKNSRMAKCFIRILLFCIFFRSHRFFFFIYFLFFVIFFLLFFVQHIFTLRPYRRIGAENGSIINGFFRSLHFRINGFLQRFSILALC